MFILKKKYIVIAAVLMLEVIIIDVVRYFLIKQATLYDKIKIQNENTMKCITEDLKCFPIPIEYQKQIYFEDSYGVSREEMLHEGCDIMDEDDKAGVIPIVSATDGVITNLGWLYLGGYRIGITSNNNIYYYYAHLDSYARGLAIGKEVKAGEFLGFMGNTGEGEEGTKGNFPVHLHFGIYIFSKNENEETVNPYPFLRKFDEE